MNVFSDAFFIIPKMTFFCFWGGRFVFCERTIRLKSQEHFVLRIIVTGNSFGHIEKRC